MASAATASAGNGTAAAAATSIPPTVSSSAGFSLTPLYGCEGGHSAALCSVLRLDDFTALLDCGWDERFDESHLRALRAIIPSVDLVLISHPDLAHLGALPYAVGKLGLTAPIYATLPVWRMGQMFMYASWQERWGHLSPGEHDDTGAPPLFSLDDVDRAFDQMRQLKYSQTVRLADKGEGIEVTPSCAGHMLGGAFWHIQKLSESIIYAVDFNHAAERHLNGALLNAPQLHRPSALITDATNVLVPHVKRSQQDAALTGAITDRLRAGGNVLLPVDAAGRVLELLLVIHGAWSSQQLSSSYTLAFLSPQSRNTVDFARSQLEWMTDRCRKMFDAQKINPFALQHVRLITTLEELQALPRPFCLLASNASLETSLAQDALIALAPDARNLLLLTSRAAPWSVAGALFDPAQPNALRKVLPETIEIKRRSRVMLEGEELEKFREEKKIQRDQKALEAARDGDLSDEEDEDAPMEAAGAGGTGNAAASRRGPAAQLYPLFPYSEQKRTFDIWGETLSADEIRVMSGQAAPALLPSPVRQQAAAKVEAMERQTQAAASEAPPHKTVVHTIKLPLHCAVQYIDLEGRSDGRSIKTVIKDVQPRKLIVLSGAPAAKDALRSYCLDQNVCSDVVLPLSNQSVSVTSESQLYRVHLREAFVQSLQFVPVGGPGSDMEVAYADGALQLHYAAGANLPLLSHPPPGSDRGHAAVFLGHLQPNELKHALLAGGVQCELVGGVCVCSGGLVNVRKLNATQISIQGALCEEYFRIRDILYEQYEIV